MIVIFSEKPEPVTVEDTLAKGDNEISLKGFEEYLEERLKLKLKYRLKGCEQRGARDSIMDQLLVYDHAIYIYKMKIEHDTPTQDGRTVRATATPEQLTPLQLVELSMKLAQQCNTTEGIVRSLRATVDQPS